MSRPTFETVSPKETQMNHNNLDIQGKDERDLFDELKKVKREVGAVSLSI